MRLIDAEALKEALKSNCKPELCHDYNTAWCERCCRINDFEDLIDNAPTVPMPDFKEGYKQAIIDGKINYSRPQGEWYFSCEKGWECNQCHEVVKDMPTCMRKAIYNFCPNCGADMRKGEEK